MAPKIRFSPKTVIDEMRIYRATPATWTDSTVMLLNDYGATMCKSNGETMPLELPDGDEVLLGQDGIIYACTFDRNQLEVQTYRQGDGALESTRQSCTVDISGLICDHLVVLSLPEGLELWLDSPGQCKRICTISNGIAKKNPVVVKQRPRGKLHFSSGDIVAFAEDNGVDGRFLNIVDLCSQRIWNIRSDFVFAALRRVFAFSSSVPISDDKPYGLYVFSCHGDISFLKTDGPVLDAGGNATRVVVSVFTGTDAHLRDVTETVAGNLEVRHVESLSGYKSLSLDGSVYAVRGFSDVLTITSTFDKSGSLSASRQLTPIRGALPECGKYIISRSPTKSLGAVIHFHGGPESQEVPEGRFFGLPQWCNEHGLDWIGVNYQGSLTPNLLYTRSAWHRWSSTLRKDVLGAIELTTGPIVLAGWSFGATIALALGASNDRIKGLLLGAATGDLKKHVDYAIGIDPKHRDWFIQRFDFENGDALFFNGVNSFRADLHVLEFHGENDMNCPAFLANQVAKQWEKLGNPWTRVS
ncbi:hypothetical protein QS713_03770 [Gleimia hominis]|uniref:Alpha/beta hydrolase n=2 Tax=Gleimia hominis TaxID=595468 RepID=A0ABU3I9Y4_9ACTO|nr:hypothetical protein [Gleimia hominis]